MTRCPWKPGAADGAPTADSTKPHRRRGEVLAIYAAFTPLHFPQNQVQYI